ncbi:TetR/AcrR family transcriptional regulator [Leekyejoonella antrihumi]|nr:TetR family transcriptional regulator C-terminal domain-containing protein [Leekyejoonella antrihumi]
MARESTPADVSPAIRLAEAVCAVIADHGLERASIREVASEAGVSIGAVQHHFRTKDDMLVFVFEHIVRATTDRVRQVPLGQSIAQNLSLVLRELLPLDATRQREARVYVAFAARAATSPRLAAVQAETLAQITGQLAEVIERAGSQGKPVSTFLLSARDEAALLLAVADGLMFDAITCPDNLDPGRLTTLLDAYLTRLLGGF